MRSVMLAAALAATVLGVAACSNNDTAPTPVAPSAPTSPSTPAVPTGVITINVVGVNGAQSFSPNPATVPAGQTVVWHNVDFVVHRVALDDGKLDTGDIAPGAFSAATTIGAPGPYHCSIHPSMVGTIAR